VWADRLREADPGRHTIVAEDVRGLIGFAHTAFEDDPTWGALLDNLHVSYGHRRRGIGSRLLALTARAVVERGTGLYLWVLEQNAAAQAFYETCGARRVERAEAAPPGGVASRLTGSPGKLRYTWADPAVLLELSDPLCPTPSTP
jgi:ribosomal protein S18 acetylase RimI-like enzyme